MEFVPLAKNILILDWKGDRVAVKYYTDEWPAVSEQELEKEIFKKARKEKLIEGGDHVMVLVGNNIALCTFSDDLCFFVTSSEDENELILAAVLNRFYNAVDELSGQPSLENVLVYNMTYCYDLRPQSLS